MIPNIKQFVPSSVCLACDGCCRFKEHDSPWRARMTSDEIDDARSLAEHIFAQDVIDYNHYIKTTPHACGHACSFFNSNDHTCKIYDRRPFECQLYPFVISKLTDGIGVYMHLACPHIQETLETENQDQYIHFLKGVFSRADIQTRLLTHPELIHDYSAYLDELQLVFKLPILSVNVDGTIPPA